MLRVDAFLPGVQGNEDSPSHLVLLAAAALLALLMASGSLLSVATRVWRRAAAVKWLVLAVAATLALAGVAQAVPPIA